MKGAIYYVAIATVIFSHVKITCYFFTWEDIKLGSPPFGGALSPQGSPPLGGALSSQGSSPLGVARKLTWYLIGVYIVKMGSLCSMYGQTLSLVYPPVSHVVFDKQDVQQ